MLKNKLIALLLSFNLCLFALSACDVLSEMDEQITKVQNVLQEVEDNLRQAQEIIGTLNAYATQVAGSKFLATVQSASTQVAESSLIETAQSIAALKGPALIGTVQSFVTEQVPKLQETAKAVATRFPTPPDIPVMKGDKINYRASQQEVYYQVEADIQSVLAYYEKEMPNLGWERVNSNPVIKNNRVILRYDRHGRQAVVELSFDPVTNFTSVKITLRDG